MKRPILNSKPVIDWMVTMGTVLTVIGYSLHPNEEQSGRLLHLVARYAELCERLGAVRKANPAFKYASDLGDVAEMELGGDFTDLNKRYLNIASTRVMYALRQNADYEFAPEGFFLPVDLDDRTVSVQIPSGKITKEPALRISIAADREARLIIPCEYELRLDDIPAKKAGSPRLYYYHHNDTWEVRVTAQVDEDSIARALKAVGV